MCGGKQAHQSCCDEREMGGTYHNKGRGVPGIGRAKAPKSTILWALVGVLAVYALIAQRGTFSSGDQGGTNQGRVVSSGAVVRQSSDLEEVRLWPAEGSRKEAQTKPKERWTQKKKAAGGGRMLDHLPHTYFDIEIAGVPKGRIVFALYRWVFRHRGLPPPPVPETDSPFLLSPSTATSPTSLLRTSGPFARGRRASFPRAPRARDKRTGSRAGASTG